MKKNLLYIALAFSMLINVAVLCVLLKGNISSTTKEEKSPKEVSPFADYNKRQTAAENAVRRYVCENLYYPNSYDPVSTKVDSVFYNYLTDEDCVKAAFELIDLRRAYESAKDTYDENVNNIKVFGGSGVFRDHTINRDKAAAEMKDLKPKNRKKRSNNKESRYIYGW